MADTDSPIARRRAFAIIAHPDAGKTTLTEKLLLYGGAIQMAGHVRAKRDRKGTRSDWMKLEQERGISINTSCMQFAYDDHVLNLLDTPGHEDFSEDTYRTLAAVESAIMLLDAGKGVEPQTIKLFNICKQRNIPIVTFINKMDMPALEPFELIDNIEQNLGITSVPMVWPLGSGRDFKGVFDLARNHLYRYERTAAGAKMASEKVSGLDDPELVDLVGEEEYAKFKEDVAIAAEMLPSFDKDFFLSTQITPVFFGSAINNFGIELLLRSFLELAPPPGNIKLSSGADIAPTDKNFTAFIFKLQANMNKAHRDRVAFARITSGEFNRGMQVTVPRLGKEVKLSSPVSFFGQDRSTIDKAYAGDIIGLINPRLYQLGDILCTGEPPDYHPLPKFAPEAFARLVCTETSKLKQFRKGLDELAEEGVVQVFNDVGNDIIIGGVGFLQFDVFNFRLRDEYNVPARIDNLNFECSRWISSADEDKVGRFVKVVHDLAGNSVLLFDTQYMMNRFSEEHPAIELLLHPPSAGKS